MTETNSLLLAAGCVIQRKLVIQRKERDGIVEPWWKRRLKGQLPKYPKDLSRLERWKVGELQNKKVKTELENKYRVKTKGLAVVSEELKQRVKAVGEKIKRYENRGEQYWQNRLFQSNQKRLFYMIDGIERGSDILPDAEESKQFWSGIWHNPVYHNEGAEWLRNVGSKVRGLERQKNIVISPANIKMQLRRMPNWKSPGPDGLQGFWLKKFTSCIGRTAEQLQMCLDTSVVPKWMTLGKTVLIVKDKDQGSLVTNFRPITCLSLMWKLLTGLLADEMYSYLKEKEMLPDVHEKGCRIGARGTKDELPIDKMITKNCKRSQIGLGMAWVDYKKAYDMVPHSWLQKCLEMFGVAENTVSLLVESMKEWRTKLTAGGTTLGTVNIRRGIFQGDSLSPLLFVLALIPLTVVPRAVKAGYDLGEKWEELIIFYLWTI